MLTDLRWLGLEAWFLDRARAFYADALGLPVAADRRDRGELAFDAGDADLVLREPGPVPRGGLHVHYALATPPGAVDDWASSLGDAFDVSEHDFGSFRSAYVYDPDANCVEFAGVAANDSDRARSDGASARPPVDGVFEVVLEVEDLARAEAFYTALGFEAESRSGDRPRVRLGGAVDLELWEPHRGIADARGGVHADLGFEAPDPDRVAAAATDADAAVDASAVDDGVRIRDPDGHYLTIR